ncbi:hypothetical protein F5882DRAFT_310582, partial [Hyaloscypha sp. PMI_1271]
EHIQSAQMIEEDTDWDLLLKKRLFRFSKRTQALQFNKTTSGSMLVSPYGDDWDIPYLH